MKRSELPDFLAAMRATLAQCAGTMSTPWAPYSRTLIDRVEFTGPIMAADATEGDLWLVVQAEQQDFREHIMAGEHGRLPPQYAQYAENYWSWRDASELSTIKALTIGRPDIKAFRRREFFNPSAPWIEAWPADGVTSAIRTPIEST